MIYTVRRQCEGLLVFSPLHAQVVAEERGGSVLIHPSNGREGVAEVLGVYIPVVVPPSLAL